MLIYDIEIANPIPPSDGSPLQSGINYSKGWDFPATMGVACIGVYDYTKDSWRVFGEYELEDFQKLINSHDRFVGFNNIGFDNKVLATCNVSIPTNYCYDILSEIYHSLGSRQKGCRLNDVIKANFPTAGKNGDGAEAPILWQRGYHTKVIDYCLNDVRLTKMLLDRIIRCGWLKNPINPEQLLKIRRP